MKTYKQNEAVIIETPMKKQKGESIPFLVMSDIHFDSIECERNKLKRDLEAAKDRGAGIIILGDLFDAMGGKYDPRTHKGDIRPEYNVKNYFDCITADAARFFTPYKDLMCMVSQGNHEGSVLRRQETDLIDNFLVRLGGDCQYGKYTGYVRFKFMYQGKTGRTKDMYYSHGSGGNSPVTKGVINTARRAAFVDADIVCSGHLHSDWEMTLERQRLGGTGKVITYPQIHFQTSTYKKQGAWEKEKGFPPSFIGGRWLNFNYRKENCDLDMIDVVTCRT